jgi:hypothetical protein
MSGVLAPAGEAGAVALAPADGGLTSQLWWMPTDGTPPQPLAGRLTAPVAVSPDGTWVAYLSARGLLGLRSDTVQLRAVRPDGRQDVLLVPDVSSIAMYSPMVSGAFSPDGSRIALLVLDELLVASMNEGNTRRHELHAEPSTVLNVLGWTAAGDELVLRKFLRERAVRTVIVALDVRSGKERALLEVEGYAWPPYGRFQSPWPAGIHTLPVMWKEGKESAGYRLELLDVASGQRQLVSGSVCYGAADLRESWLAYASCAQGEADSPQAAVHVRDLGTQIEEVWATVAGKVSELQLSRDGSRVALEAPAEVLVIDRGGVEQQLAGGWQLAGWAGRDRILLMKLVEGQGLQQIAVADASHGELRTVFPPGRSL